MPIKKYTVPLYDFMSYRVVFTDKPKKYERKFGIEFPKNTASCVKKGNNIYLILNLKDFSEEDIYDVLAHECVHAKNYVFSAAGIKPDVDNDEPEAYLVGWFMNKTVKELNKYKNYAANKKRIRTKMGTIPKDKKVELLDLIVTQP